MPIYLSKKTGSLGPGYKQMALPTGRTVLVNVPVHVFVNEEMKMEEEYKQAKTFGILFLDLNNPSSTSTFTERPWLISFQG